MSRLNAELERIDKLSLGSNWSAGMQTIVVSGGVIIGLLLLFSFRTPIDDEIDVTKLRGPLAAYTVKNKAEDLPACRAASCTYTVASPTAAKIVVQREARYLPPPIQTITAPPGQVFRDTRSFNFEWITSWVSEPTGYTLVNLSRAGEITDGRRPESGDAVKVPTPGYVRSAKLANSNNRITLNGTLINDDSQVPMYEGTSGQIRLRNENPSLTSLAFQPLDKAMTFEVADIPVLTVGDVATIQFDKTKAAEQTTSIARNPISAEIIKLTRSGSPTTMTLQLGLSGDQVQRLLRDRIALEKTAGETAFPATMNLSISPRYGKSENQSLRVPTSAIVRQGTDLTVWLVVDDFVIPLSVDEVERDAQSTIIIEKAGARGLPISAAHWRALSPLSRSRVYLAAGGNENTKLNQLLRPTASVIEKPDNTLRSGTRIRRANVSS